MNHIVKDRVRWLRHMQGLSQRDLAESAGLSAGHIHKVEHVRSVTFETALKLKDALGLRFVEELTIPLSHKEKEERRLKLRRDAELAREARAQKNKFYKKRHYERKKAGNAPVKGESVVASYA